MQTIQFIVLSTFIIPTYIMPNDTRAICYAHEISALTVASQKEINYETQSFAHEIFKSLNQSPYFNTTLLRNGHEVRKAFRRDKQHKEITVTTADHKKISYSFFDRQADTLLFIAPGFTNSKEKMAPFLHMFPDIDIIITNYRGHGLRDRSLSPLYKLLGIGSDIRFGAEEEKDVFAVMRKANEKRYKQIIGLGVCFGAFVIAKAQALATIQGEKLFDKIILDGMWKSLPLFTQQIIADPALIFNPQKGGASPFIKSIFRLSMVQRCILGCISKSTGVDLKKVDITSLLQHIQIPTLLFYGKDDLTIPRTEFEETFNALGSQDKAAIITSNEHVLNHIKSKELFTLLCQFFIHHDFHDFKYTFIEQPASSAQQSDEEQQLESFAKSIQHTYLEHVFDEPEQINKTSHKKLYFVGTSAALAALLFYRNYMSDPA